MNTTHAEYDATLPLWQRMRTVLAGEDAVIHFTVTSVSSRNRPAI